MDGMSEPYGVRAFLNPRRETGVDGILLSPDTWVLRHSTEDICAKAIPAVY
jgi:hypothetical protein